jgi:purine nucleosidase
MAVPLILDTDIGTDADDALALAFALRHPEIDLRAVTTVSGDTVRRGHIAKKLLRLAGRDDIEVAAGDPAEYRQGSRSAWMGHEGDGLLAPGETLPLSPRDAVTLIVEECGAGVAMQIATVGMQTNVAAAAERDPELPRRVARLAVMGGVFAPVRFLGIGLEPTVDHNLNVDPSAAVRALNAGFRTLYVPCDVTFGAWLERRHLDALRGGDALCRALAQQVDVWTRVLRRRAGERLPEDCVALLHDPLTVACVVDRRFVTSATMPVTVALHHADARTFIDPAAGQPAEVITSVDARGFADFWLDTVLG